MYIKIIWFWHKLPSIEKFYNCTFMYKVYDTSNIGFLYKFKNTIHQTILKMTYPEYTLENDHNNDNMITLRVTINVWVAHPKQQRQ